jgi:hypothetical protein
VQKLLWDNPIRYYGWLTDKPLGKELIKFVKYFSEKDWVP